LAEKVAEIVLREREGRQKRRREVSTTSILARNEEERVQDRERSYYWMNQPAPPLMHFPWMFQGPHESN